MNANNDNSWNAVGVNAQEIADVLGVEYIQPNLLLANGHTKKDYIFIEAYNLTSRVTLTIYFEGKTVLRKVHLYNNVAETLTLPADQGQVERIVEPVYPTEAKSEPEMPFDPRKAERQIAEMSSKAILLTQKLRL